MASAIRRSAVTGCLVLSATLAACGTGSQPARAGTTVTVLGRRFTVDAVDVVRAQVRLEALC
jgi:hypothetical protein